MTISDDRSFTMNTEPIVVHEEFIVIPGKGKVKATFDFSEMHPDGHAICLRKISSSGCTYGCYEKVEFKYHKKKSKEKKSFNLHRLLGIKK